MDLTLCRAKIHRVRVTDANLAYEGSITLDAELLEAAGILPYEKVQVVNVNNGARLETYVIQSPARPDGPAEVCLNGPAARLGQVGDVIIVIAYGRFTPTEARGFMPRVVNVDENNRPIR